MAGAPPVHHLARFSGRPVLALAPDGRVLASAGLPGVELPTHLGQPATLRRMLASTTATPATWTIEDRPWRAFGMRWGADDPAIVVRLVPPAADGFSVVTDRLSTLERRQREVRRALERALVAERDATERADQLARTNQELEDYAAVVAHDLRAPLRTSRILADRALDAALNKGDADLAADLAQRLDDALGRLDRLVLRLLDYAALTDRGLDIRQSPLRDLVLETLGSVGQMINREAVDVQIAGDAHVRCDRDLLGMVLREAVTNASKYNSPDRPLKIRFSLKNEHEMDVIEIADNGIGVEPGARTTAFDLFQRLSADSGSEGLGIGLNYCRRIVELHGGSIRLTEGINGAGTTVVVSLPADRSELLT